MGMPKLNLSSGGMLAAGLAQGAEAVAGHYELQDKQNIADASEARRQAALEQKEKRMADYRSQQDRENAIWKRDQEKTWAQEDEATLAGQMSEIEGEDSQAGGYEPPEQTISRYESYANKARQSGNLKLYEHYTKQADSIRKVLSDKAKDDREDRKVKVKENEDARNQEKLDFLMGGGLLNKERKGGGSGKGLTTAQETANLDREMAAEDLEGWGFGSSQPIDKKDRAKYGGYGRFFSKDGEYVTEFNSDGSKNPEFIDMRKKAEKANKPYAGETKEQFRARQARGRELAGIDPKRPAKPAQSSGAGDITPAGKTIKFDINGNRL